MKIKLTAILAVLMLVAMGPLNASHANAKATIDFPPAPSINSMNEIVSPGLPPATNFNFEKNHGRITRIYPEPTGVYFRFGGQTGEWQTAMNPANGYYFIPLSHPNYKALVDLLYLAAEHDWNLQARTQPTLDLGGRAEVMYLVQDFTR